MLDFQLSNWVSPSSSECAHTLLEIESKVLHALDKHSTTELCLPLFPRALLQCPVCIQAGNWRAEWWNGLPYHEPLTYRTSLSGFMNPCQLCNQHWCGDPEVNSFLPLGSSHTVKEPYDKIVPSVVVIPKDAKNNSARRVKKLKVHLMKTLSTMIAGSKF